MIHVNGGVARVNVANDDNHLSAIDITPIVKNIYFSRNKNKNLL